MRRSHIPPTGSTSTKQSNVTPAVVQALRDGDHAAFDTVFLAYYAKTRKFVSFLVKSDTEAEDIVSDIFVSLWAGREKLMPDKNFNAYLYTVTRNAVFNFFRSNKVRADYLDRALSDSAPVLSDEEFIARETQLLVDLTVANMPEQRGRVYSLSRNEGLTNDEISQRLGISKKAVEKQLRLALADLRKVVQALTLFLLP